MNDLSASPMGSGSPLFAGMGNYRVYKDAKEFTTVSAINVLEALKNSGLSQVYKVERYRFDDDNVLDAELMQSLLAKNNPPPAAAEPPQTPPN